MTVSVTLTNGAGNSTATTLTETKATVPPPLAVSVPQYINNGNVGNYPISATGGPQYYINYSFTDGKTTITGGKWFTGNGSYATALSLSTLKNGPVTLTTTETDFAGNQTVRTLNLTKLAETVPAPTVALNASSDTGVSSSDYITSVTTPVFTVTLGAGAVSSTVYVNGVQYSGQALAPGSYTVTATDTDQAGNGSAAATAPKTLVIVTNPPAGSWTVSGGKVIRRDPVDEQQDAVADPVVHGSRRNLDHVGVDERRLYVERARRLLLVAGRLAGERGRPLHDRGQDHRRRRKYGRLHADRQARHDRADDFGLAVDAAAVDRLRRHREHHRHVQRHRHQLGRLAHRPRWTESRSPAPRSTSTRSRRERTTRSPSPPSTASGTPARRRSRS